jgi:pantoate--beta-alanine ligase
VELIEGADAFRATTDAWREADEGVGFVPTMGALHGGHVSLVRRAREHDDRVAVSIFVNPLQFGAEEDFDRYPRPLDADLAVCEGEGVDAVWVPPIEEVYPIGMTLPSPDPGPIGGVLEGAARPGHFAGVLTVVHRLFEVVGPSRAYFGRKDAQQLFLVGRMVAGEGLPVEVVPCPTVREANGLAISSRNAYLSDDERDQATCLFLALTEAAELARSGEHAAAVLVAAMAREIGATALARLNYATVVDDTTFEPVPVVGPTSRALVAARFPSARLIDNLLLPTPGP